MVVVGGGGGWVLERLFLSTLIFSLKTPENVVTLLNSIVKPPICTCFHIV